MRLLLLTLTLLTLAFAPAPFPRPPSRKQPTDLDRLRGTWEVIEHRYNGNNQKQGQPFSCKFDGSRWQFILAGDVRSEWELRLDPTASPRRLDLVGVGRAKANGTLPAIYRFDDGHDTLRICYSQHDARPTEFEGKGQDWLLILKRAGK